jgi:hypothetical protein
MRKIKVYLTLLVIAGVLFTTTSCVDNTESDSVNAIRNAKASELLANADYLKALASAEGIKANAEKVLKEAEADVKKAEAQIKLAEAEITKAEAEIKKAELTFVAIEASRRQAEVDLQKAEIELKNAEVAWQNYRLSISEGTKAEEIEAKKAEFEATIAKHKADIEKYQADIEKYKADSVSYERDKATYQAEIAKQEEAKQLAIKATEKLLNEIEIQKISNQTALQNAAITAEIAILEQTYRLAKAKIDADLNKQTEIYGLIAQYNQLLLDINSLERTIADYELSIANYKVRIAVAKFDKNIDSTNYVDGLKASIAEAEAGIEAKKQAIEFWNSFKVEDLEKAIAAELDTVNNKLRPALAVASTEVAEAETSRNDVRSTLVTFRDSLNWFYRYNSYSSTDDYGNEIIVYYARPCNDYATLYHDIHNSEYFYLYGVDVQTKLVEAKTIALVIKKDIEYLVSDSTKLAKSLADTLRRHSTLGTAYITAKTALDNEAIKWQTAYNGYTASPQTVQVPAFKAVDSTYCDKYAALYGGTADGSSQIRPNGSLYEGFSYNGKTYGVYGWINSLEDYGWTSLANEFEYVDQYVRDTKGTLNDYSWRITALKLTLASVNNLVGLLESGKLATYEVAYKAALDEYEAKDKAYQEISAKISEKLDIISQLNVIALGYNKVFNYETGLLEEGYYDDIPGYIEERTIESVKNIIQSLETSIVTYENTIAAKEIELEKVTLKGDYQDYPPHYYYASEAYIKDLNDYLLYLSRELEITKLQKEAKETEAAALKVTIDNAFK